MPSSTIRTASAEDSSQNLDQKVQATPKVSFLASLGKYALAGLVAVLLLSLIEWVDLNIQLAPVFQSHSERLVFTAYFSLNLLVGSIIGLAVGLAAHLASWVKRNVQRAFAPGREATTLIRIAAGLTVCAVAGLALYFQPGVFRYTLGVIREAEKVPHLTYRLLSHERLAVYLSITGLLISCWIVWSIARAAGSLRPVVQYAWLLSCAVFIGAAYYVDSRIEVQLYEPSLHRSMFLLELTLSLALVVSSYLPPPPRPRTAPSPFKRIVSLCAAAVAIAGGVFTFAHFDKNQNLKTQVYFRSTQSKQYFKLAQWTLDFDRDGYSAVLGGGDADDTRADINPARPEITGDGLDNNCIGGDISQRELDDWTQEHTRLNAIANPNAKRFNVIFIFVDALRADHLSLYGYGRNTSPNLSRLAERACVFDNAFTPSPYTFEAFPKFMKSCYWDSHAPTWTEVLAQNGYHTILFPRRTSTMLRYVKGIDRVVRDGTEGLKQTVDAAIDVLGSESVDRPFGAFVYISDPHRPYSKHEDFDFGSSVTDLYDAEVAYTDVHLGRLFDWLDKSGRINDTMVVVIADHGESLGERGVYKHSTQLYNEQAHVPMIFYLPGVGPRRIAEYVSTIDLGSTILNAVGANCPKEYLGVSLLPLMQGELFTRPPVYGEQTMTEDSKYVPLDRYVYSDTKKYMVVTQDGYKLIYNRDAYCFELFDLKNDIGEEHNLFDRMPEKAAEMKSLIGRFVDVVTVSRPPDADEKKYDLGLRKAEDR